MKTITDVWLLSINCPKETHHPLDCSGSQWILSSEAQFHRLETKLWCRRGARLVRMGMGCHYLLCLCKTQQQGCRVASYIAGTSSRTPFLVFRRVAMGSGCRSTSHRAGLAPPPGGEACSSSKGDTCGGACWSCVLTPLLWIWVEG